MFVEHELGRRRLDLVGVDGPVAVVEVELRRDRYEFHIFGLQRPRHELYRRINDRVVHMFREGLMREVAELISRGYSSSDPGMKAIGYREFYIMRSEGCRTLQDTMEMIQQASRRYAKRQITFFKKLPQVCWIDPSEAESVIERLDSLFSVQRK